MSPNSDSNPGPYARSEIFSNSDGWRVIGPIAVLRSEIVEELSEGASPFWKRQVPRIVFVLRWFVPPVIAVVLFFSLSETIAAIGAFLGG